MRYEWQPEDVVANYGQVVARAPNSEHYMFAYERGSGLYPCLVSLRDGMICHNGLTIEEFAKMLNDEKFVPFQYKRPMLENVMLDQRRIR